MATSLGGIEVPLDYSTRDYAGYRADVLALAPTLTPEWTDFYPGDVGVVIAEMFSYIGDNLSYYIDRAANESYLPTATQRRSVINLGRLMGYELRPATSAVVVMFVTTDDTGTIPAGAQVATDPSLTGESVLTFEAVSAFNAPSAGTWSVEFIEGSSVAETLGSGNSLPGQEFDLGQNPLSLDPGGLSSLSVYVDAVKWTEVPNFLSSEPGDQHYVVQIDENDIATIVFGNGVNGAVVPGGVNNVTCTYRVGGGARGNSVGANQIIKNNTGLSFVTSVTNGSNTPQGGQDKETLDQARESIPGSLRALDRAVTHEDYETLAVTGVGGVAQAKATWGVGPYEEVVYVAAAGANPIASGTWDPVAESGTGLIGQVGDYLAVRKASPIRLVVRPPDEAPIELALQLEVNSNFFQSDARTDVESALLAAVEGLRMGEDVVLSELMCAVEDLASIRKVRVTAFRRTAVAVLTNPDPFFAGIVPDTSWDIGITEVGDYQSFVLTSAVQPTLQEVLTVTFTSATTYNVIGSASGLQSQAGVVGLEWTNDLGNVTLLATPGATPNYSGTKYRITVGSGGVESYIFVGEYEIATLALADITIASLTGGIK